MEKVFPGTAMFMKLCIIVEKVSTNSIIGPSLLLRRKAQTSMVTKYQGRALLYRDLIKLSHLLVY
jgi:hypothetical protein